MYCMRVIHERPCTGWALLNSQNLCSHHFRLNCGWSARQKQVGFVNSCTRQLAVAEFDTAATKTSCGVLYWLLYISIFYSLVCTRQCAVIRCFVGRTHMCVTFVAYQCRKHCHSVLLCHATRTGQRIRVPVLIKRLALALVTLSALVAGEDDDDGGNVIKIFLLFHIWHFEFILGWSVTLIWRGHRSCQNIEEILNDEEVCVRFTALHRGQFFWKC